jgi:cyclic pyranopterin phosphate synthase
MTRMVDISQKEASLRMAKAKGTLKLKKSTVSAIKEKRTKKGDVLSTAKTAAILAVKKTPDMIPLCHPIPINSVDITLDLGEDIIVCECTVSAHYSTGVEMESLVGVSVALLTVWDMVKYLEKDEHGQYPITNISNIKVVSKHKA